MKPKTFLLSLYNLQNGPNDFVYSIDLEQSLGTNFNTISKLSSYWEEIGAVTHLSERGGLSTTYKLTNKGLKLAKKYHQINTIKKASLAILILITIIILILTKG